MLRDGRPSPPLKRRLRAAVELHRSLEDSLLVCTGGTGRHGPSEARVMRDLATQAGVDSRDILLEEKSYNTRENIQNSLMLMREMKIGCVHVVSDDFHLPRCRLYAALAGIRAEFHPAASRGQGDAPLRLAFYRAREAVGLVKYAWVGLIDRFGRD